MDTGSLMPAAKKIQKLEHGWSRHFLRSSRENLIPDTPQETTDPCQCIVSVYEEGKCGVCCGVMRADALPIVRDGDESSSWII